GLLEQFGLSGKTTPVLRALDKLPKIGPERVREEMVREAGATPEQVERVLALAGMEGSNDEILARLERDFGSNERAAEGIRRLRELTEVAAVAGVPEGRIRLDLSIARG